MAKRRAASSLRALGLLLRVQLQGVLASMGFSRKSASANALRAAGIAAAVAAVVAIAATICNVFAWIIGLALGPDAIFGVAVTVCSVIAVVMTLLRAGDSLFGFLDYDMTMSLPVPTYIVVLSRVLALYLLQLAISLVVCIPMFVAYCSILPASPVAWSAFVLTVLLSSTVPVSVSIFLAYLVKLVSTRFAFANLAYVVLSLALMVAISIVPMFFMFDSSVMASANTGSEALEAMGVENLGVIATAYPLAGWMVLAAQGDTIWFLPFALVSLATFVLAICMLTRGFMSINAALAVHSRAHKVDIEKASRRQGSVFWTMLVKEWRCQFHYSQWALNAHFGLILQLIFAVALIVMGKNAASSVLGALTHMDGAMLSLVSGMIDLVFPWMCVFCCATATAAAGSVSMEGRASWVMATAPVPVRTVLASKLVSGLIPAAIVLTVTFVAILVSGLGDALAAVECVALGFTTHLCAACVALYIDVLHPNFAWTRAKEVFKSSSASMVAGLGGLVVAFGGGFLCVQFAVNGNLVMPHVLLWAVVAACVIASAVTFKLATSRNIYLK